MTHSFVRRLSLVRGNWQPLKSLGFTFIFLIDLPQVNFFKVTKLLKRAANVEKRRIALGITSQADVPGLRHAFLPHERGSKAFLLNERGSNAWRSPQNVCVGGYPWILIISVQWILDSLSVERGFRIPNVSRFLELNYGSKADSTSKHFPFPIPQDSGIRVTFNEVRCMTQQRRT